MEDRDWYKFRARLQDRIGKEQDAYRAVEIVTQACQKMEGQGIGTDNIGIALINAAALYVFDREDLEEYWHFAHYIRQLGELEKCLVEEVWFDREMIPTPQPRC